MAIVEGRELGGCRLLRKIGAGGMGAVYLAEQLRVGNRLVAVKVVNPDDHTFDKEVADDLKRRFEREAALLGQLPHPNILPVYDSGVEDGLLYLVMEYVPDGSLADAIRGTASHPLKLPAALPFTLESIGQLGTALQYVHDHGVVHRDVKPGNVLVRVGADGQWKMLLADFGVARNLDTASQRTQVTGTFAFMAPEQFSGSFSPASDQYALGVLTFLLLAGRTPFDGDLAKLTKAHMFDAPPSLHKLNPSIPVEVEAVVNRSLAKDAADRWPSVAEFVRALTAASGDTQATRPISEAAVAGVLAGERSTQRMPAPSPAAADSRNRGPWRILVTALAAVLLLIAAAGGAAFVQHQQQEQQNAQATQAAQTAAAGGSGTATVTLTPLPIIQQCAQGRALGETDDATCIPLPPVAVGASLLDAPAPSCDTSGTTWISSDNLTKFCGGQSSVTLTANSSGHLACLGDYTLSSGDGFTSVFVTSGSGAPVLAIRQQQIPTGGNGFNITGYYFHVSPSAGQYTFYRVDANGAPVTAQVHPLQGPLAAHFVLGILYHGHSFTLYVNGVSVGTESDPTYASGGFGICADRGSATFRDAQVFPLAG